MKGKMQRTAESHNPRFRNVRWNGTGTDSGGLISAIGAGPNGRTEERNVLDVLKIESLKKSKHWTAEGKSAWQALANFQLLLRNQNVGYNGKPTDSGPVISANDAGSNGITE
jgi:hypothetical protein